MKFSPDSPELTAYAVGELPEPERAALEAQLATDPQLQAELAALQATMAQLQADLANEPTPALAPVQRAWIEGRVAALPVELPEEVSPEVRPAPKRSPLLWWIGSLAAAAALVVAIRVAAPGQPAKDQKKIDLASVPATDLPSRSPDPILLPAQPADAAPAQPARAYDAEATRSITANLPPPVPRSAAPTLPAAPLSAGASTSPLAKQPDPTADVHRRMEELDNLTQRYDEKRFRSKVAQPRVENLDLALQRGAAVVRDSIPARPEVPTPKSATAGPIATPYSSPELSAVTLDKRPIEPQLAARYGLRLAPETTREAYAPIIENPFRTVEEAPLSTFGMDVDTASYANVRRYLREGTLPPPDAVRLEELINYFPYDLPAPQGKDPFGVVVEVAACPWNNVNRLIRVALKARDLPKGERPHANLVFLVDVSGSMEPENKLPLVKKSLRLLVEQLTPQDRVALVTYAGEAGVVLESTAGSEKPKILEAIERLGAGGSTHGSAGIQSAYDLARKSFVSEGVNRVLLCTDGDFNVGTVSRDGLIELITQQARSGVFLSVLGYGVGNYQDATAELLADRGNGNYAYIDSFREARKVLHEQLQGTLVTVAKDAKIQIEFNPRKVARWRLLGYENRQLADRDFKDDQKDAGDVGAGQSVTVLYEIVPSGPNLAGVDPLRYQKRSEQESSATTDRTGAAAPHLDELFFLKLRHKLPDAGSSTEWTTAVKDDTRAWTRASDDFQFSAAVAGFGLLLRNSAHRGSVNHELVLKLAQEGLDADRENHRAEFIDLVRQAQRLQVPR